MNSATRIRNYLDRMDNELIHCDGSAEITHEEAKKALRDVYLLSCGEKPEFHPSRVFQSEYVDIDTTHNDAIQAAANTERDCVGSYRVDGETIPCAPSKENIVAEILKLFR